MAPMYYRGSSAALIVYDITSLQSFLDVKTWIEELRRNMKDDLIMMIVGAKSDLEEKREISLKMLGDKSESGFGERGTVGKMIRQMVLQLQMEETGEVPRD